MLRHARRLVAAIPSPSRHHRPAGPASATLPGENGRIVFMRFDADGRFQVWTANPDMTHQVQLTHGPDWDGWFPSWSPDHTRIAFSSYHEDPDPDGGPEIHDVYTMNADGTDVRKITDSQGYNGKPSWSPDGRWLLFDADRFDYPASQGIYRIRSDGSGSPRRITSLPAGLRLAGARPLLAGRPADRVQRGPGRHLPQDDGGTAESSRSPCSPFARTARGCAGSRPGSCPPPTRTGRPTGPAWCSAPGPRPTRD